MRDKFWVRRRNEVIKKFFYLEYAKVWMDSDEARPGDELKNEDKGYVIRRKE